jgi:glycosyltransferase involved in cell wall biosynthesis
VVGVGRLAPVKGFDLLIRAHATARAAGADHILRLIGEGPHRAELEALVRELGVQDSVDFTGFQANPLPDLAAADLFVLSSRFEGSGGLVLLEALALGVPIVAVDCPSGPRRLLSDGRYGRLVPSEDVDALAAALVEYVKDPEPLRTLAAQGPQRAADFDPATTARELYALLLDLSGRARPNDSEASSPSSTNPAASSPTVRVEST